MENIVFKIYEPQDVYTGYFIAEAYQSEWKIAQQETYRQLPKYQINATPFQITLSIDNQPIATGGIYNHVGLLTIEPRFAVYKNWLALVYTIPEKRGKGYGAMLCEAIEAHAKTIGLTELHLFTHTAESLYKRLGWQELERLTLRGREIVVMRKAL
jgi:GNAT superfamily N-acetyltransferase